jgi:hypothetical protein
MAYPALACAAILAALFDSAQEAIDALDDANDQFTEGISTDLTHIAVVAFLKGAPCDRHVTMLAPKWPMLAYLRKRLQRLGAARASTYDCLECSSDVSKQKPYANFANTVVRRNRSFHDSAALRLKRELSLANAADIRPPS